MSWDCIGVHLRFRTMKSGLFGVGLPNLPNTVTTVSDGQCDRGPGGQALSCVYTVTEPPPVNFPPPTYYVAPMGPTDVSAASTTSANHWKQPAPQPQYIATAAPVSRPGTYGTPPKPEMTVLLPVCIPSTDAGYVMSPTSVMSTSPVAAYNPLMNSTKYIFIY